jgi:hypothetical protein
MRELVETTVRNPGRGDRRVVLRIACPELGLVAVRNDPHDTLVQVYRGDRCVAQWETQAAGADEFRLSVREWLAREYPEA